MRKASLLAAAALAGALGLTGAAQADNNLLFIFDASNSMWGQIDGVAKIETARDVLKGALGKLDPRISVGLMAYGHRRSGDCGDIETLSGIGARPAADLAGVIDGITPRGRTPLAGSLEASWEAFHGREEANNTVVLISDGIETCEGDPCAVAASLAQRGVNVRIHTVGFDVDEGAERQLICIADAGGGEYFRAENPAALDDALDRVVQVVEVVETPEPAPDPGPTRTVYFHDEFDGANLAEEWTVLNPDPNSYIVDAGELLMVNSGGVKGFQVEDTPNVIRLDHPLPDGDWDIIVRMRGEFKTLRDSVWFGLYTDSDNFMGGHLFTETTGATAGNLLALDLVRSAGGDQTYFRRAIRGGRDPAGQAQYIEGGPFAGFLNELANRTMILTLTRRGREYRASLQIEGEVDDNNTPIVYETDALTSLRPPGAPAIAVGQWESAQGETLIYVDSITIETVN